MDEQEQGPEQAAEHPLGGPVTETEVDDLFAAWLATTVAGDEEAEPGGRTHGVR